MARPEPSTHRSARRHRGFAPCSLAKKPRRPAQGQRFCWSWWCCASGAALQQGLDRRLGGAGVTDGFRAAARADLGARATSGGGWVAAMPSAWRRHGDEAPISSTDPAATSGYARQCAAAGAREDEAFASTSSAQRGSRSSAARPRLDGYGGGIQLHMARPWLHYQLWALK